MKKGKTFIDIIEGNIDAPENSKDLGYTSYINLSDTIKSMQINHYGYLINQKLPDQARTQNNNDADTPANVPSMLIAPSVPLGTGFSVVTK